MRDWKRGRGWIGGAVAGGAVLLALGASGPAAGQETIKLGVSGALTGPAASFGVGIRRGAELAIEEINAKGGVKGRKLELVVRDDEHNPVKTVAQVRELVEREKVVALLGATNSASMLAVAPIINDTLKVPVICPATDATKITENDAWQAGRDNYVFRYGMFGRGQSHFLVNMAVQRFGYKKPALLTWTAGWGVTGRGEINARLTELKMKAVADETYDTADNDISPQVLKIRNGGADVILNYGLVRENVNVVRAKEKVGDKTPYFSAWGLATPAFWRAAGSTGEGVAVSTTLTADGPQPPERVEFLRKYHAKHGPDMDFVPGTFAAYDIVYLYAHVMEKAGTDPNAVRAALENVAAFKGLVKDFKRPVFTKTRHDALQEEDFVLGRWTNGKLLQIQFDAEGPFVVLEGGAKRRIDKATFALK
jgi:branched-chain amino acid transport system substrate-binding protein